MIESVGLLDIDMTPIKRNLRELSKSLQRLRDIIGKRDKLPNGRYRK